MSNFKKLIFVLVVFILIGCKIQSKSETNIPSEQFAFLHQTIVLQLCDLEEKNCTPYREGTGTSSSVLVAHTERNSYYLTAAHVCNIGKEEEPPIKELKIKIIRDIFLYKSMGEAAQVKEISADIFAIDVDHDLCLLQTELVDAEPIKLASGLPKKMDKILNLSAPTGVWSKDVELVFEGTYQGELDKDITNSATEHIWSSDKNKKGANLVSIWNITLSQGSSGSPVVNSEGEMVGMVSFVLGRGTYHSAGGPSVILIREFINKSLF